MFNKSKNKEALEKRLKELEALEAAYIEAEEAAINSATLNNSSSSTLTNLTTSSVEREEAPAPINPDDLKRIEFQRKLLQSTAPIANNEERKNEIANKFGLHLLQPSMQTAASTASHRPKAPSQLSVDSGLTGSNNAGVQNADKQTIYSGDSGIASGSNYFNMNLREQPQLMHPFKKPINLAVENLNSEIRGIGKHLKNNILYIFML